VSCSGTGVTCGGGGQAGVCGCTDDDDPCLGKTCGTAFDKCGRAFVCGPLCMATFDAVGHHTWTVPVGTTRVQIEAYGAAGGAGAGNDGGLGGYAKARMTVSPGQVLHVFVGGAGANGTVNDQGIGFGGAGGFNGGGDSGDGAGHGPGGGGGASDVRLGGTSLADRIVVAGGGGGEGGGGENFIGLGLVAGGGGGGPSGEGGSGVLTNGVIFWELGGTPGSATEAGTGGWLFDLKRGGDGAFGVGGDGASQTLLPPPCFGGGGGGGGWYGGGGGAFCPVDAGGGGGGGSGFITSEPDLSVSDAAFQTGVRPGNGLVVITLL
jgi:hypothetical protein